MKYERSYCESCKLIWGRESLGRILNCTKCGHPLILKSFNPWLRALGGVIIMGLGALTLLVRQIPVIWIGGFIFGISIIIRGFSQWADVLALDRNDPKPTKKPSKPKEDKNSEIFTCGQCAAKIYVPKNKGATVITCPNCKVTRRVMT